MLTGFQVYSRRRATRTPWKWDTLRAERLKRINPHSTRAKQLLAR